jgi:hypothetical protein
MRSPNSAVLRDGSESDMGPVGMEGARPLDQNKAAKIGFEVAKRIKLGFFWTGTERARRILRRIGR